MPFFYSQYLKDERKKGGTAGGGASRSGATMPKAKPSPGRRPAGNIPRRPSLTGGRLVWHSNTGASGHKTGKQSSFKPLKYSADGKRKKVVHFATIEVQPFHFDWDLADEVFYTRKELTAMGQDRFEDAALLRQQRKNQEGGGDHTMDDVDLSKRSKTNALISVLALALDDPDGDENVSIRGIEHFVYPDLQQEMIRRKKQVQREVLEFVRSKRPDPQGWRLAQHSRNLSQWARNVAMEKGIKYCMNNAAEDPDVAISEDDLERFQKSRDELENSSRELRGSASFSNSQSFGAGSQSFDNEHLAISNKLRVIGEDEKNGADKENGESQRAMGEDEKIGADKENEESQQVIGKDDKAVAVKENRESQRAIGEDDKAGSDKENEESQRPGAATGEV